MNSSGLSLNLYLFPISARSPPFLGDKKDSGRSLQEGNVTIIVLSVLWQLFDKTACDFPGVEIDASDLGLAPHASRGSMEPCPLALR
ncbi:MAG: hypothetical protein V5A77_08050 [Candidatus Bipolaricaulota bacterium]